MSPLTKTENDPTTSDSAATILNAARVHGITLQPDRLQRLANSANYLPMLDEALLPEPGSTFVDSENGLWIDPPKKLDGSNKTAAMIDFLPKLPGYGKGVASSPMPEHTTRFTLMAIHGLQNYLLLVDAGALEKPDILTGFTNPEMAIVAERVGLLSDATRRNPDNPSATHHQLRNSEDIEISGSFDEISERIFSADTQRLEQLLTRRLASQERIGELALAN